MTPEQQPAAPAAPAKPAASGANALPACCPSYHEAVEFIGKRWTGAIVRVLMHRSPLRFSELAQAVPQLSDRLLSERVKELEARGVVERRVLDTKPPGVEYALTPMGHALEPALTALEAWAQVWLRDDADDPRR